MTFQENLTRLRRQDGLSQEKLGELLGVSRQTVSKWELGSSTPELEKLVGLCDVFHISMDEMVGRVQSEPRHPEKSEESQASDGGRNVHTPLPAVPLGYEFKSRTTVCGVPLVHINLGFGFRRAKGIFAIGNIAEGVFAFGGVAIGLIAVGGLAVGLCALGGIALALLLSVGGVALAPFAFGGLAIGYLSFGGCAVGRYALGGAAVASRIAVGGWASAPIAVGWNTNGTFTIDAARNPLFEDFQTLVLRELPNTPKFILKFIYNIW